MGTPGVIAGMPAGNPIRRPVMRYHGGKFRAAPWVISHLPRHRVYVEPFGGAASVLLLKPPAQADVYNDIDEDVVNVFQVLRDPALAEQLRAALELTPYSRVEFDESYHVVDEPRPSVERARRTLARAGMAFSTASRRRSRTGFRATPVRASSTTGIHDWMTWPEHVPRFVERLRSVILESRPALDVIRQQDNEDALFYVDPPYVESTRSLDGIARHRAYARELTDDDHAELAEVLHGCKGMVAISGYCSDLYDRLYADWPHYDRHSYNGHNHRTVERLWLSPRTLAAHGDGPLFQEDPR